MAQPLLSIGMIVKNEIRCIEKCLKALQPLREAIPCQLVIADTGSDDGTREVAEQYADVLFDFPWINDFSAARNAVLDRCTGKWTLVVDADEYLLPDVSQLVDFLAGPEAERYSWGCVDILNYSDVEMKQDPADSLGLRLMRMDRHPRYEGTIHEALSDIQMDEVIILLDIKFMHDGYRNDKRHPEIQILKMERNLSLLDQELEQDPEDLRRLLQCVESSGPFPSRQIDYVRRSMKALQKRVQTRWGEILGPVLCRYALVTATAKRMPELDDWRRWAEAHYPDSMFLRLDGIFSLMKYEMDHKNYKDIPALARTFLAAWKDYHSSNFNVSVLMYSTLYDTGRKFEVYARAAGAEALARLNRSGEAADLLTREPGWEGLKSAELALFLKGCIWAAGEEPLQAFVAHGAEVVRAMTGEDAAGMWDAFRSAANAAFQKRDPDEDAPERPWRLFTKVEGGIGQAVQIMEGEWPEIEAVLPLIKAEDWEDVPAPAVIRAVELGAELPEAFFTQSRERLTELATQISEALTPEALLNWAGQWDFTSSMTRFQFLFDLLSAALRADKTWEEETEGQLSSYSGEHVIFPVVKGFPNYPRLSEAFSPAVHPVFLALAMYGALDPTDVPYLKQHEPIGCRDAYTLVQMQKYGISAYLNGCITVCLSPPPATGGGQVARRGAKKVFLVDTEPELEAQIPPELPQKSVRETHAIAGDLHTSPLLEAERVLREYWEDAELVITSRLHAAVPCLSMGIPVILAKNIYSSRFAWVDRLIPVYQLEQYGEIDWHPKTVDLGEVKSRVFDLVKARLWSAYQMATALREIHHFYSQRPEVPYETALSQTVPAIRSRFSPFASFTYAVWGITSMAESVVQYMQRTYPNAKLAHAYDKFRRLHFHGIETQTPDALLVQGDDLVIACPLSGSIAEQMSDFFHTEHFPEERFIVASDIV